MNTNYATAIPTGAAMTLLLLLGMHGLIAMQPMEVSERTRHSLPTFIFEAKDETLIVDELDLEKLKEVPDTPPLTPRIDHGEVGTPVPVTPKTPTPKDFSGRFTGPAYNDGPLVALVRVQPTYPAIATTRGLEGHVIVQFDVYVDGTVGNISVLESSSSIFERAAIQAASRFRFKARVLNGEPQASTGVQYRFKFEMNK